MSQLEILAVLLIAVAIAHWLGDKARRRLVGSACWSLSLAAGLANLGVIPLPREQVTGYYNSCWERWRRDFDLLLLLKGAPALGDRSRVTDVMLFGAGRPPAPSHRRMLAGPWLLDAGDWMGQISKAVGQGCSLRLLRRRSQFQRVGDSTTRVMQTVICILRQAVGGRSLGYALLDIPTRGRMVS